MHFCMHCSIFFLCVLVIELSRYVVQLQGSICTAHELSQVDLQAFHAPVLQLFRLARMLFVMDVCMSIHELSDPLSHIIDVHSLWPIDFA